VAGDLGGDRGLDHPSTLARDGSIRRGSWPCPPARWPTASARTPA
jgi:hypothetical protein